MTISSSMIATLALVSSSTFTGQLNPVVPFLSHSILDNAIHKEQGRARRQESLVVIKDKIIP